MTLAALPDDFRDLLVELADHGADFVVVGGWALAAHGRPRATEDLDVLVRATPENAERVFASLAAFGAPLAMHGVRPTTFVGDTYGYRFGVKPHLIEVLTHISGVDFDEASRGAIAIELEGRTIRFIGRTALLANERAAGRPKDLDDVAWLEAHPPKRDA